MDQTASSPSRHSHLRATRGFPPPSPRPPSRLPAAAATTPFLVGGGGAPQPPHSPFLLPPSFSPSSSSPLPTPPPWSCSRSSAAAGWCPLLRASKRGFGLPLRGSGSSGGAGPTRSTLILDQGLAPLPVVDALGPQPRSPLVATSLLRPSDAGATSILRGPAPPACHDGPPPRRCATPSVLVGGRVRRRVRARGNPASTAAALPRPVSSQVGAGWGIPTSAVAPAPLLGWVHGCRRCCPCRSPGSPHLPVPPSLSPARKPRSRCGLLSRCRRRPSRWQWCLPFTPSLSMLFSLPMF
jgi:hypothetical protein